MPLRGSAIPRQEFQTSMQPCSCVRDAPVQAPATCSEADTGPASRGPAPCTPLHRHIVDHPRSRQQTGTFPETNRRCASTSAHLPPDRRWVKLLRILSPQAELSSTSKTSAALTALFCLLRFPVELGAA